MDLQPKRWIAIIRNTFFVVLGSMILGFASAVFLIPNHIVTGGMAGAAIIFNQLFAWSEEITITVMTWVFFVVGAFILGKKFALQTLCSTIVYPLSLVLFSYLYTKVDLFQLQGSSILGLDNANVADLLASIFGGIFTGVGCAITFIGGGSTGGVDIPALILQKYTRIKCSHSTFLIDATIILIGLITLRRLDLAMIGIISAFFAALMIDKIFVGGRTTYLAYIISSKYEEINAYILTKLERGTTLLDSQGGFSGQDYKMIQVVFDAKEYSLLLDGVKSIDATAFMSVMKTHEVKGNGFRSYDTSKRRKKGEPQNE